MPVDVATPFLEDSNGLSSYCRNPETKSGSMILIGPGKHTQSVQVKVYRTSLEHFAVVYPQKKVCRPLGVLNLRNTRVERLSAENMTCLAGAGVNRNPLTTGLADIKIRGRNHDEPIDGFVVRQRGFDTPNCLTFISESPKDVDSWVKAFTSQQTATLHASPLPMVEEGEEV